MSQTPKPQEPAADRLCPGCKQPLKDTAKPHCREKRSKPCGWVVCDCQTTSDARGNYYPRKRKAKP